MSNHTEILSSVLELGRDLPSQELPSFLGKLEEIRVTALSRLHAPAPVLKAIDELLPAKEAARRLSVSVTHLYHVDYDFTVRDPRTRRLRFSARGIEKYIAERTNKNNYLAK